MTTTITEPYRKGQITTPISKPFLDEAIEPSESKRMRCAKGASFASQILRGDVVDAVNKKTNPILYTWK